MVNADPPKLEKDKETEKDSQASMSNDGIGVEAFHIPSAGIAHPAPVMRMGVMMPGQLPMPFRQQLQIEIAHKYQQQQTNNLLLRQQSENINNNNSTLPAVTHNLIPVHLPAIALAPSLHGSPGNQPNMNNMMAPPLYNGINPNYPGLRMIHANPPVFCVDNFLSDYECDFLIHSAQDAFGPAPVVGKGVGEVSPSRTSSTCYLAREDLPDYMRKVSALTGKPVEHCELPQVGRYFPSEQYLQVRRQSYHFYSFSSSSMIVYLWKASATVASNLATVGLFIFSPLFSFVKHFDAFDLSNEDGRRFASNGGQRVMTVLVYLNDVQQGGATAFPALNLQVQPRRGMALVFFPATVDGMLDKRALHAAMPAIDTKFISQVWVRQSTYNGQPSKRLLQTMGVPFQAAPPVPMSGVAVTTAMY